MFTKKLKSPEADAQLVAESAPRRMDAHEALQAANDALAQDRASSADNPWMRAQIAYEDRVIRSQAQVANWRMFAFFSLAIAAVAVSGAVWIGGKSKLIPMVFEVDNLRRTVYVATLHGDEATTDANKIVYSEMFELFENLRSVTTDREANNARLRKGFSRLTGAAATYVRTELRKAPPNEVGATKTVQVTVRSALKLTGKSWQVDWDETSFGLDGKQIGDPEHFRATLQTKLDPSDDEKEFRKNPSGLQIPELSWQKVVERAN
jgi:type IV secretory pathway TrbF-like protein